MGNKWGSRLLGELCHEITVGFVGSMTNEYIETGIPFLRSKNINEYDVKWDDMKYVSPEFHKKLSKSALKPGDVAIVRTGKPGTTCVIPNSLKEANCSDVVIARVNDDLLCPHYLSYFMNAMSHGQVNAHVVGAVQQHFNVGSAKKLEIPLPSRAVQSEIVQVLKTLDDKLKLNRQINQTLEQMAQALFRSWFVDFDPVVDNALDAGFFEQDLAFPDELLRRAEARRAVREHRDFKSLPDATRQLFPAAFEECAEPSLGLGGWVPQGWKIAMLDEITCELRRGVSPKYVEEGGVQVINQKCIRNHEVSYEPARRHNHEAKKIDGRELCIGDVLVNSTGVGTLGRIAQVTHLPETTVVDSHVTVVRVKDDVCPIYTFGQLMLSMEGKIEQLGEGSTGQTELSRKILSEQLVILPPSDIAGQVEKTFKSFSEKQVSNRKQCSTLTNLRDTLLPKLISGELRLDQIEADLAKEGMA
ncbi:restriction endonuclease subunit S [Aeromonas veronii]|uniref:restriction endonuclease subunit S n=1 Tax=Aeromonas veronii TaxID=654 RepID=UPI002B49E957|nr:restriction endonuclease subunit S [Aeromonas veronii]